jgi:hypothetical protein
MRRAPVVAGGGEACQRPEGSTKPPFICSLCHLSDVSSIGNLLALKEQDNLYITDENSRHPSAVPGMRGSTTQKRLVMKSLLIAVLAWAPSSLASMVRAASKKPTRHCKPPTKIALSPVT